MKVREIMTKDPKCVLPEESVGEAAKFMKECDCGAIPVVENHEEKSLRGIITDRDIVLRCVAVGKNPLDCKVQEAMSGDDLATVHPDDELEKCVSLMEERQVRRVPVVDEDGRLVGIVVQAQIARIGEKETVAELVHDISR